MHIKTCKSLFESGHKIFASAASLMVLTATALLPVSAADPRVPAFRPAQKTVTKMPDCKQGQLIIVKAEKTSDDDYKAMLDEVEGSEVKSFQVGSKTFKVIQVGNAKFQDTYKKLKKDKRCELVSLNYRYRPSAWPFSGPPDDPDFPFQVQLFVHNVVDEWPIGAGRVGEGGAGQIMTIIDTGVQGNQLDLQGGLGSRVFTGLNLITGGPGNVDTGGTGGAGFPHGTFIGTEVASTTNNALLGASEDYNSFILPFNVFDDSEFTFTSTIIEAIGLTIGTPSRVINISINGEPPSTLNTDPAYMAACEQFYFRNNGLIFNAAGNSGLVDTSTRRKYNVVVAAVDANFNIADFSVVGPAVYMAGAGVDDVASTPDNTTIVASGTSFAAPACAAIALNMFSLNPALLNGQVLNLMVRNSIHLRERQLVGAGVPQADRCINAALNSRGFFRRF